MPHNYRQALFDVVVIGVALLSIGVASLGTWEMFHDGLQFSIGGVVYGLSLTLPWVCWGLYEMYRNENSVLHLD